MDISRRELLRTTALGTVAVLAGQHQIESALAQVPAVAPTAPIAAAAGEYCTLPALPYAFDALEPHIDAQTMQIHHDKHHGAYVKNLNTALADHPELRKRTPTDLVAHWRDLPAGVQTAVRNQGGGHVNHCMFWLSLSPKGGRPLDTFAQALERTFGGVSAVQEQMTKAAAGVFGSGWAWLSQDSDGTLIIETTPNQDNPLTAGHTPLLGIDVWEHAYYLKYQNRRADYLSAIWNVVDWGVISTRYVG